jgi:hypothetical protein
MTVILYAGRTGRHIYYDICRQVMSAGNPSGKGPPDRTGKSGKKPAAGRIPCRPEKHICPGGGRLLRAKSKKALKSGNSALEAYSQVSYYIDVCPDGSGSPAAGQAMKYRQYQNHI